MTTSRSTATQVTEKRLYRVYGWKLNGTEFDEGTKTKKTSEYDANEY